MAFKPKSASDVLRKLSPRKAIGKTFQTRNMFAALRDASPAGSDSSGSHLRERSVSQKRKNTELSYASQAKKHLFRDDSDCMEISNPDITVSAPDTAGDLVKVKSLLDKVTTALQDSEVSPSIIVILSDLVEAIRFTNQVQIDQHNARNVTVVSSSDPASMTSIGAVPKPSSATHSGYSIPRQRLPTLTKEELE